MSTVPRNFDKRLVAAGGELLAPTNPYEIIRFRTRYGVGIVYRNKRGAETWNEQAMAAKRHLDAKAGSLAAVQINSRKKKAGTVQAITIRDGAGCFYCGLELADDSTVEHLVSVAHGGPNHISNMFLAHAECNQLAGHLSAPEKIALRDKMRKPQ